MVEAQAEVDALKLAMGEFLVRWGKVEELLLLILSMVMLGRPAHGLAVQVLAAQRTFKDKVDLIRQFADERLKTSPDDRFFQSWKGLETRLRHLSSKVRNRIAHNCVCTYQDAALDQRYGLIPSPLYAYEQLASEAIMPLFAKQVREAADDVSALAIDMISFHDALLAVPAEIRDIFHPERVAQYDRDTAALLRRIQ